MVIVTIARLGSPGRARRTDMRDPIDAFEPDVYDDDDYADVPEEAYAAAREEATE